jgi:uncharacterized metal-binding protein
MSPASKERTLAMKAKANGGPTLVIPCSGIGKVHGLIGREATYEIIDRLTPGTADTLCLALLVTGDEESAAKVRTHSCITIDGCPKACAQKNIELAGGKVTKAVRVVDAFRNHRGAQPGTATKLSEEGWTIVHEIADETARAICGDITEGDTQDV